MTHAAQVAWTQAWHSIPAWVLDVRLLAATLVLVLSPSLTRGAAGMTCLDGISRKVVVTAVWLSIVAGMFFCPSYFFHVSMPPRTLNATYTLFVLGWLIAVFTWFRADAEPGVATPASRDTNGQRFARSAALAILGLSLLLTGNTCKGITALSKGVPQKWQRMNHWRDRYIREAMRGGATEIVLPVRGFDARDLVNRPDYPMEISDDPGWWSNAWVAWYYGLKSIRRVPHDDRLSAGSGRQGEAVGLGRMNAAVAKE